MVVYFGEENAVSRIAKIKALQDFFKEPEGSIPKALTMLEDGALGGKGSENLIVSGHGNQNNFGAAGITGDKLFATFQEKGITKKRFAKIYLMGCNIGLQAQDNSVVDTFAKAFAHCVNINEETAGIKVYAPRGILTFTMEDKIVSGQTVKTATDINVKCPERTYPLSEGLTLVNPS
jgi:hypothetical protein